jgi:hypothetical protein
MRVDSDRGSKPDAILASGVIGRSRGYSSRRLWQGLVATHRRRYRAGFHANLGRELPERFAVPLIYRREASVRLAVKNQASGCGEHARPTLRARGPRLRNLPNDVARWC